jgi:cytoskeleton protein RodZ
MRAAPAAAPQIGDRMSTGIGETLRETRRSRQLELADVSRATKIRASLLDAIEEERWEAIPGRAYVRSFVRTYAEFLAVDPAPLLDQLKEALPPTAEEEIPPEPIIHEGTVPGRRPGVGWIAVALGATAVVAAVIAIASDDGGRQNGRAGSPAAQPSNGQAQGTDAEPPTGTATQEPSPPTVAPTDVSVTLEATGTVWVCLEDERGERLVNSETLTAGERRGPFVGRRLLLGLGNGQVEVRANGKAVPVPDLAEPLGFELTPEQTRDLEPAERPTCT